MKKATIITISTSQYLATKNPDKQSNNNIVSDTNERYGYNLSMKTASMMVQQGCICISPKRYIGISPKRCIGTPKRRGSRVPICT